MSGICIFTTLRKLVSTSGFDNNIMKPGVRQVYSLANKFHHTATNALASATAQRQYSNTFNYQRTHCRLRVLHKRTSTTVPHRKIYRGRNRCLLLALLSTISVSNGTIVTAAMASTDGPRYKPIPAHFDTDSFVVGLDSHASTCMTPDKSHLENLRPYHSTQRVKGIGEAAIKGVGTMVLEIVSDDGQPHIIKVDNTLYVPALPKVLLSPQHFSENCAWTCTEETALLMKGGWAWFWFGPKGEYLISTPNSKRTNVPEIMANRGCSKYESFASHVEKDNEVPNLEQYQYCQPCTMNSETEVAPLSEPNIVSDDEESVVLELEEDEHTVQSTNLEAEPQSTENIQQFIDFGDSEQPEVIEIEEKGDVLASSDAGELLRYHYRFGHMSFNRLRQMAKEGIIPRRLAKAKIPTCAACQFGKMTKKNWRTRKKGRRIHQATRPGQVVSVDQMESSTKGFIAQMKGLLTKRRYTCATIFVDHFSDLSYVHLQESLSSKDTLMAKRAFEAFAAQHGIHKIQHYHCDNGRFADNAWKNDVRKEGQTITFCAVNGHFQNGRAEKRIRDLRESARTSLLHAIARWPGVVDTHLWPYALRYANDVRNNMPSKDAKSPLEHWSDSPVQCNYKDFHAFGCPVYALNSKLAGGNSIPHWDARARLGVNLGMLEQYTTS